MISLLVRKWLGEDPEVIRFRVWFAVFVIWCVTGVMSCGEIKYLRHGETAVATRVGGDDLSSLTRGHATYRWQDAETGENRNKVIERTTGVFPPEINIQYIPGGLDSRPASGSAWIMPAIFLVLTVAAVGWMVITGMRDKRR